jgi:anaerobic selenocysteine-containing dehydrogenase
MKKWRWKEGNYTVTRSVCWSAPGTHGGCSVLIYSKDGKLVKVEGDIESSFNQGRLCARTLGIRRFMEHPQRLMYPLKRIDKKSGNEWTRIPWDEAIDTIVEKFEKIKRDFGPESTIFMQGTGRDSTGLKRLADSFGSPNFMTCGPASGLACFWPKIIGSIVCTGETLHVADMSQFFPDRYNNLKWEVPKYIVVWGSNPTVTCSDWFLGHWIVDSMKHGSEVIVIDPRRTWLASRAKQWVQIRPGTDAALALGILNVIITEDIYDHEFVDKWTHGFEGLKARVEEYSPTRVSEITGVPAGKIIETARQYATNKPSCVQWGVALDQTTGCLDSIRSINALIAITGNFDVPGGNVFVKNLVDTMNWGDEFVSNDAMQKKFGPKEYPLWSMLPIIQPDTWMNAMDQDPCPTKAAWIQGTNTFIGSFADPKRVYNAFKKLDFVVVLEIFNTPTVSAFADIVLPVAMFPERDGVKSLGWDRLQTINKAVEPPGECKSDLAINLLAGKRFNPEAWPWNDEQAIYDDLLRPWGMTFKELRDKGPAYQGIEYRKHEKGLLRKDKRPGFNTDTGKIEIHSTLLEKLGYDSLPKYEEPPISPKSTPKLAKEYPLILTTGGRVPVFFHSEHRQVGGGMREINPDPMVEIHPETAKTFGISNGDWVWIENHHGRCKMKARLTTTVASRLVHAQHSWWFPEKPMEEPTLGGAWESNINLLLPSELQGKTGFGYPFKVNLCKVYPYKEVKR